MPSLYNFIASSLPASIISFSKEAVHTTIGLIFLLGVLVFFHELGHFIMAKLLKMRVEEFAFGFGPKWIRLFKIGETEYTIHPIPLGGFVKMVGGELGETDVPGGFNTKPWYSRMLVYFAGPFMSFVLAYILFSILGFAYGIPTDVLNRVDHVMKGSLAEKAGLRKGDVVIEINSKRITTGKELVDTIHGSPNKPLTIVVNRHGRKVTIHATPELRELGGKKVGMLGFTAAVKIERVGLWESIKYGTMETYTFIVMTLQSIFSRNVAENVGGPIAIAMATKEGVKAGLPAFLRLMGLLSLSLGVVNLMPIPVVDGGQIMLLFVEAIKRRRLSPRTWETAYRIGLTVIALLFLTIMYLDLARVFSGGFSE
jgi:regulator of sigma E protease